MKCKCVICGIIIDVKGINPQNQKCKACKEFEKKIKQFKELKRFSNSLYGKTLMNRFTMNKNSQLKKQRQDKISFAVKQLEKVKNYMITDEKDMFGANYLMNSVYVLEFIDNQIKQLKEMK